MAENKQFQCTINLESLSTPVESSELQLALDSYQVNTDDDILCNKIANLYLLAKNFNAAIEYAEKALTLNDKSVDALIILSKIHSSKSENLLEQALQISPTNHIIYLELATLHFHKRNLGIAKQLITKSIELQDVPTIESLEILAIISCYMCDFDSYEYANDKLISACKANNTQAGIDPFRCYILFKDLEYIKFYTTNWVKANIEKVKKKKFSHIHRVKPAGKIRVGYISNNFNPIHVVGLLVESLIKNHPRNDFTIVGLFAAFSKNHMNFLKIFDESYVLSGDDSQKAYQVFSNNLDILIDLDVYSPINCMGILAYQPAPIQCTYLGLMCSTYTDFIQYHLCDDFIIPDGDVAFSEKIIKLPNLLSVEKFNLPKKFASRKDYNLPEDKFIFCCITAAYRIDKELLDCWAKILNECKDAVLWLSIRNEFIAEKNVVNYMRSQGISPNRIIRRFVGVFSKDFAAVNADLYLDTFKFSCGAKGFLSYYVGLPILTYSSDLPQSRLGGSIAKAANAEQMICSSQQEYVQKAIFYYNNQQILKDMRQDLVKNRDSLPVYNQPQFFKEYTKIYGNMIDEYYSNN